jgi:hypothetical protein
MPTLVEILLADERREQVVRDCVTLIEQHIASRGLLRRTALRAGVAVLDAIRPNALDRVVRRLLPDSIAALEPLHREFAGQSAQREFSRFLLQHSDRVVPSLMALADQRAADSPHAAVKSTYARLRATAQDEVREALPALARLIAPYVALRPPA